MARLPCAHQPRNRIGSKRIWGSGLETTGPEVAEEDYPPESCHPFYTKWKFLTPYGAGRLQHWPAASPNCLWRLPDVDRRLLKETAAEDPKNRA